MTTRKTSSNVPARSPAKAPKVTVPKTVAKKKTASGGIEKKTKTPAKPAAVKTTAKTATRSTGKVPAKPVAKVKAKTKAAEKPRIDKIGKAAAQLHHLLKELGHIKGLERSASTMPDARERLNFIDRTMHEASEKTISAVENSLPLTKSTLKTCARLSKKLSGAEDLAHHALVQEAITQLGEIAASGEAVHHDLMQIMEAQEFRDVAGQMVNKIVGAAVEVESILLDILREYAPNHGDSLISHEGLTAGPAVKDETGGVQGQDDVDDLLASMGF